MPRIPNIPLGAGRTWDLGTTFPTVQEESEGFRDCIDPRRKMRKRMLARVVGWRGWT